MIPAGPPQAKTRRRATTDTPQKHGFHKGTSPGPNPARNQPPRHRSTAGLLCGHFLQKMTTNGRNGQSADSFNGALGPLEPYALGAAMHKVDTIRKLNEPDPMVHQRSLWGHSPSLRVHWKGPRGARGRLPVMKRWPWSSRRPIPVQHRVRCCLLS